MKGLIKWLSCVQVGEVCRRPGERDRTGLSTCYEPHELRHGCDKPLRVLTHHHAKEGPWACTTKRWVSLSQDFIETYEHPNTFCIQPQQLNTGLYLYTGCISVPQFAYEKIRAEFVFRSLLTQPEVICALSEIWSECNKVATMKLFNVTSVKPLRLEEFEVLQSQMHTQVLYHQGCFEW